MAEKLVNFLLLLEISNHFLPYSKKKKLKKNKELKWGCEICKSMNQMNIMDTLPNQLGLSEEDASQFSFPNEPTVVPLLSSLTHSVLKSNDWRAWHRTEEGQLVFSHPPSEFESHLVCRVRSIRTPSLSFQRGAMKARKKT